MPTTLLKSIWNNSGETTELLQDWHLQRRKQVLWTTSNPATTLFLRKDRFFRTRSWLNSVTYYSARIPYQEPHFAWKPHSCITAKLAVQDHETTDSGHLAAGHTEVDTVETPEPKKQMTLTLETDGNLRGLCLFAFFIRDYPSDRQRRTIIYSFKLTI